MLKSQSLENGLSCVFQAISSIPLQKVQSPHDSAEVTIAQGLELKEWIQHGVRFVLLCYVSSDLSTPVFPWEHQCLHLGKI